MEGGYKPWRQQTIVNNSPDLDSYGRPLPPPPSGYFWERRKDLSWELMRFASVDANIPDTFPNPCVLEHVVMPSDTIQGICLRYRVSAIELRRHNNFSGNNIQFSSALRIPIEHEMPVSRQIDCNEVKLQRFKNITQEDKIEASYYLEDNDWDFEQSLASWKADKDWNECHYHSKKDLSNDLTGDDLAESVHSVKPSKRSSFKSFLGSSRPVSKTDAVETIEPWMIVEDTSASRGVVSSEGDTVPPNYDNDSDIYVIPAAEYSPHNRKQASSSEKIKNSLLSLFGRKSGARDIDGDNALPMMQPLL